MITWMHDGHHEVSEPERASAPEWHSNVGADEVAEIRLRSRPVIGACSGRAKLYHIQGDNSACSKPPVDIDLNSN